MACRFEPLAKRHDRAGFRCASPPLNVYLQQLARKDVVRRAAAVFVMVEESTPATIMGYYTLSSYTIEVSELPEGMRKKLPESSRISSSGLFRNLFL